MFSTCYWHKVRLRVSSRRNIMITYYDRGCVAYWWYLKLNYLPDWIYINLFISWFVCSDDNWQLIWQSNRETFLLTNLSTPDHWYELWESHKCVHFHVSFNVHCLCVQTQSLRATSVRGIRYRSIRPRCQRETSWTSAAHSVLPNSRWGIISFVTSNQKRQILVISHKQWKLTGHCIISLWCPLD